MDLASGKVLAVAVEMTVELLDAAERWGLEGAVPAKVDGVAIVGRLEA